MKDSNNCECAHYVVPAPFSMTSRGWGCLHTGGHCVPEAVCGEREQKFIEREKERAAFEASIIASDCKSF